MGYQPTMQLSFEVPGDQEAVLKYLKESGIPFKLIREAKFPLGGKVIVGTYWIKNTLIQIYLGKGKHGNRLFLDTVAARETQGKPVKEGWGDMYMPAKYQERLFNRLRLAVKKHRQEFFKKPEAKMQRQEGKTAKEIEVFENRVLAEEHRLEEQIKKTKAFLTRMQKYFPKAAPILGGSKRLDDDALERHKNLLDEILAYLKAEEIEAVHILRDAAAPILIRKGRKRARIQKKHLRKLSSELSAFVKETKYFSEKGLRTLVITPAMKEWVRGFYERLQKIYEWYAELFKKETGK